MDQVASSSAGTSRLSARTRPRSSDRRRIATVAGALGGLLIAAAIACQPALAVIITLPDGQAKSYRPLRGAPRPLDALFLNLDYNGGHVMPSNTNYTLYWRPAGAPAYPSGYQAGVDQYLADLAHDSGRHTNVDSSSAQYNDTRGDFSTYDSHFAGALIDTDPYPASGCAGARICLTDAQIQTEIGAYATAHHLPSDRVHEYFVLTPPGVESCFDPAGAAGCSAGSSVKSAYCAYHGTGTNAGGEFIYANDPFVNGNPGCDDGNHPNGSSDGALQGGLSHEHNESITDPEPNNGWTDLGGSTGENGDKCDGQNGAALGTTPGGANYNQVVNGHFYWYQTEYSNQGHACVQRFTPSGTLPVATFTSAATGTTTRTFDATGSSAPGGVRRYNWQFNDGSSPALTTAPTVTHTFPGNLTLTVGLTVFAPDGASTGTSRVILVTDEQPTAAFSVTTTAPRAGASVSFASAATTDSDGSISSYDWNFGDGSAAGSGAAPSHVYATPGTYQVTMTATDSTGQTATVTHAVALPLAVGALPTGVAASADGSNVYVANASANTVSVVDTATNAVTRTIDVGAFPVGVATSSDGGPPEVYVANYRAGTVSVIDAASNTVTSTIDVSGGNPRSYPSGIVAGADGVVDVADAGTGVIVQLAPRTSNVASGRFSVGGSPAGLALTADGHLLVANARANTLQVLDSTHKPVSTTALAGSRPAYVTLNGTTAYVALPAANQVAVLANVTTATPTVSLVDVGRGPYGVAAAPALDQVVATSSGDGTATVLSTQLTPVGVGPPVAVGSVPDGVAVATTATGTYAYVANEGSNSLSVIRLG